MGLRSEILKTIDVAIELAAGLDQTIQVRGSIIKLSDARAAVAGAIEEEVEEEEEIEAEEVDLNESSDIEEEGL